MQGAVAAAEGADVLDIEGRCALSPRSPASLLQKSALVSYLQPDFSLDDALCTKCVQTHLIYPTDHLLRAQIAHGHLPASGNSLVTFTALSS